MSLICKHITHEKYFTVQTKVGDDESEEIFNNKTDLTNQENVTSNEGRIVSEKLKDRKCEKVRASKRKERKGEKRREKDWERKLVLTIWNSSHNNNWAWCFVFIVHNNHNYLINLPHYMDLGGKVSLNPFAHPNPPILIEPKPTQLLVGLSGYQPN